MSGADINATLGTIGTWASAMPVLKDFVLYILQFLGRGPPQPSYATASNMGHLQESVRRLQEENAVLKYRVGLLEQAVRPGTYGPSAVSANSSLVTNSAHQPNP